MKFIVDAQLPAKLKYWLIENGYENSLIQRTTGY